MNTSLFVGLCEDAGLDVDVRLNKIYIDTPSGDNIAEVNEIESCLFWIDTYPLDRDVAVEVIEAISAYACTPIEERE